MKPKILMLLVLIPTVSALSSYAVEISEVVNVVVCKIFGIIVAIAGGIAALVIAFAGIQWVMSREEPGVRKTAFESMKHAVIGLILILVASTIVSEVSTGTNPLKGCTYAGTPMGGGGGGGGGGTTTYKKCSDTINAGDPPAPAQCGSYWCNVVGCHNACKSLTNYKCPDSDSWSSHHKCYPSGEECEDGSSAHASGGDSACTSANSGTPKCCCDLTA